MASRRSLTSRGWPADLPLALGFEVIRQVEAGLLEAPRPWMEQIIGAASADEILNELDRYLKGTAPVELGDWVTLEMPSHEAAFVDDRTHIIRAALVGVLMSVNLDRPPARLRTGDGIAAHRDTVRAELLRIAREEGELRERFGIVQAEAKAGAAMRALDAGFAATDREARDQVRHGRVDSVRAENLLRRAVVAEWSKGFPRSLLGAANKREMPWRRGVPEIVVSQLELKEFFLAERLDASTMELMGANWARAILARETELLVGQLTAFHQHSWRLRSLEQRIARAKDTLERRGHTPTHFVGPWDWRIWRTLLDPSALHGRRDESGAIGNVMGLTAYEVSEDFDFVAVLALPAAITVRQRTFNGEDFDVSVKEIGPAELEILRRQGITDVDGAVEEEPIERIQMRAWVTIRESPAFDVSRDAVVSVALPSELRDHPVGS